MYANLGEAEGQVRADGSRGGAHVKSGQTVKGEPSTPSTGKVLTVTARELLIRASQAALAMRNPPANAGDTRRGFDPEVRKIPWKAAWQATPVFSSGDSHGQRSLAGYTPWDRKELDAMT